MQVSSAASGAVFVDLANLGRLDLYVSNNANRSEGSRASPSAVFRNDGGGGFTDVSAQSGACPPGFLGRTAAAADFDGDGLLDLLACEFYYGTRADKGIALYRNLGNYHFQDVTEAAGLPRGSAISGAAVGDVNVLVKLGPSAICQCPGCQIRISSQFGRYQLQFGVRLAQLTKAGKYGSDGRLPS